MIFEKLRLSNFIYKLFEGGAQVENRNPNDSKTQTQEEQEILNAELIHAIREGCYTLAKLDAWPVCINFLIFESRQGNFRKIKKLKCLFTNH